MLPPPPPRKDSSESRPAVPPRRKSKMGGLWGMASALGMDRGLSWGEGNSRSGSPSNEKSEKSVMGSPKVPPPTHPTHSPSIAKRFVAPIPTKAAAAPPPPPLPTRNRSRTIVQPNVNVAPAFGAGEISEESSMYSKASEEEQMHGELLRLRGGAASYESLPEPETETEEGELQPSTSQETNQDAFHTPTDEPAEFSVPSSPTPAATSVPAPTQAPAPPTPAHPTVSPRTSIDAPPGRSASPATPSSKRNSVTGIRSRTSSPAPPPVPRRAAARNRPVPPPPSGSRPRSGTTTGFAPVSLPVAAAEPSQLPPASETVPEEASAAAPAPAPVAEEPETESASALAPATEANSDVHVAETSVPPPPPTSAGEPIIEEPAPATHIPLSNVQEVHDEAEKPVQPSSPTHSSAEAKEPAAEPATGAETAEMADAAEGHKDSKHHREESRELVFTAGSDYDSEPPHSAPLHPPPIPAPPHSMLETSTTAEELMRQAEAGEHEEEEEHDAFVPLPVAAPAPTATPPLPARSRGRSGSIMQPPPPPKFASRRVGPVNGGGVNGVAPLAVAGAKEKITPVAEESEKENISVDVNVGEKGQGAGVDGEVYVGEATWEERTWKELVKLREDMFWARIGGVR